MSAERTEKPTARRRQEARKKGQIARSRDLAQTASLVASTVALSSIGSWICWQLARGVGAGLTRMGERPLEALSVAEINGLALASVTALVTLVAPVAGAAALAVIACQTVQGGWMFSPAVLHLDFSRLNPVTGLRRMAPSTSGVELLKAVIGLSAIGYLAVRVLRDHLAATWAIGGAGSIRASIAGWQSAETFLTRAAVALGLIAAADYAVQRWRTTRSLKMTKQEVRDDMRQTEGNPEIKARVQRIHREMVRKRMLAATKKATVVITNPTEYAVALEYRRLAMAAPRVVAKGRGVLARRIKQIARDHDVPIVENVPLARALYKAVDVGETIPAALFEAVAEILAYLVRLKQVVL